MESGGMNYFPWWLVEKPQIEATILSYLQIQILMKITVLKGQCKENQTEYQKIMYLHDHHLVRKKRGSFSDCLQSIAKSFVEKDPTDTLLKFLSEENEQPRQHEM